MRNCCVFVLSLQDKNNLMKPLNPFPTTDYISPEYFCDREEEQKQLVDAVINHRNITVVSRRRLGKTALIKHCFHLLKERNGLSLHFFDIYATQNLNDFINLFAVSLLGYYDSKKEKILAKITNLLGRFRPKISFDELTGKPSIELTLENEADSNHCLASLFGYLAEQKTQIIIAIDEFQQIITYPEKNVEALLRTHMQNCPNVTMIFSGSNKRMMISMFNDYAKPFYQSSGFLFLGKIDEKKYTTFIKSHFRAVGRSLTDESLMFIFSWTHGYTYFVQEMCNRLYATEKSTIEISDCKHVADQILKERDPLYAMHGNLLTKGQFKLLQAIAHEGLVTHPNSSEFIRKHKLQAASSVKRALEALEAVDLVSQDEEGYIVNDIFLMRWLQQR